jgi:hypothetical protein
MFLQAEINEKSIPEKRNDSSNLIRETDYVQRAENVVSHD